CTTPSAPRSAGGPYWVRKPRDRTCAAVTNRFSPIAKAEPIEMYGSFRSLYGSSSSGSGRSYVRESVSGFFITISNVAARTRACIVGEGVPAVAREEANKTRQQRTCNGTGDLTESSLTSRILLRPSIPQWCAAPGDEMQKRDDYVRGRSTWPVTVFPKAHASTP